MNVCQVAELPFSGYPLELFFEPLGVRTQANGTKIRSSKWDRFINGSHTPSQATRRVIYTKIGFESSLEAYFEHPIWRALAAGDFDSQYWMSFYKTLPLSIQFLIFKKNNQSGNPDTLKFITRKTVADILQLWSDEAFACLIALCRDKSVKVDMFYKQDLLFYTHKYMQYLLEISSFCHFANELWEYFQTYIVPNSLLETCKDGLWRRDNREVWIYSMTMRVYYSLARKLNIVRSEQSGRLFLYWKIFGNSNLINRELDAVNEATDTQNHQLPDSYCGLKWLIKEMNKHLPKKERINTSEI
tara:strand:+ start:6298 stop:7200 length:903 start_codon:yes stop_codon:yes gene_type:complete